MPPRELSRDLVRVVKSLKLGKLLPTLPERLRQVSRPGDFTQVASHGRSHFVLAIMGGRCVVR